MQPDRWRQIEALYHSARAHPADTRAAFLAEACGADTELHAEVERLLRHDADASAFLEASAQPQPSSDSRRTPGARLGPYVIVAPIGAGGMGEVYRAHDARLGRDVAIKVLPAAVGDDPDRLHRFEREARAAAALNHPNILAVHDVGTDGGVAYLVTELLDGRTLRSELAATTPPALPIARVLDYAVQIAEGLAAAHARGIIHRDLKPENLFVTADGRVKILDFGLAKVIAHEGRDERTMTATVSGMILGTVGYMAPEQVRGGQVDTRADIFAFGCVLYEMLSRRRAFARDSTAETLAAILEREPDWDALPPEVPWTLRHVLQRCLQKDLKYRLHHIADARIDLEDVLSGAAAAPPSKEPARGSAARWIGLAAITAALGVAAGVLGARSFEPPPESIVFVTKTFDDSVVSNARFLPDGRSIVYSASTDGRPDSLFELRDSAATPRPFGPAATRLMAVSKTGELAVLTDTNPRADTWVTTGTLARMTMDAAPRPIVPGVSAADWSPDGKELALVRRVDGLSRLEYPKDRVLYKTAGYISDIRVAPDGRRVLFMDHQTGMDNRGWIRLVDQAGAVTTLAGEFPAELGLAWNLDGRGVFFSVIDGLEPTFAIRRLEVARPSAAAARRSAVPSSASMMILDTSPEGLLLTLSERSRSEVGVKLRRESKLRDLSWLDRSWSPSLSLDGSLLLFTHGHSGPNYAAALRRTDGSLIDRLGDGATMGISPDGRWAIAALMATTPAQLVAYPVGAGAPVTLAAGPLEVYDPDLGALWLPDSRSFLFRGSERGRASRTYIQRVDGGNPRAVLPESARAVLVSRDGHGVLAIEQGQPWRLYPLDGGSPALPLPGLTESDRPSGWTEDGRGVIVATDSMPIRLYRVDIRTGARSLLREIAAPGRGARQMSLRSVTADGDQFAYTTGLGSTTLHVVSGVRGVK